MSTNDQLADKGKLLARCYIDTNGLDDLETLSAVVEHAIIYAYRVGYRSHEGEQQAQKIAAMQRVAAVLNDRHVFHVDEMDAESRDDLLGAIVDAVLTEFPA